MFYVAMGGQEVITAYVFSATSAKPIINTTRAIMPMWHVAATAAGPRSWQHHRGR